MSSMSGQDIYDNFTKHASGTAALQDAHAVAQGLASDLPDRAVQLKRLQDEMETAWVGAAGDSAQRGIGPLALEQVNVAETLHTTQDLVSRQAGSFHQAANTVRPMPPEAQLQDPLTALAAGQDPAAMLDQVVSYNAAAQHNVDTMNTYYGASSYNTDNMPVTYGTLGSNLSQVTVHPTSVVGGLSAVHAPTQSPTSQTGQPAVSSPTTPTSSTTPGTASDRAGQSGTTRPSSSTAGTSPPGTASLPGSGEPAGLPVGVGPNPPLGEPSPDPIGNRGIDNQIGSGIGRPGDSAGVGEPVPGSPRTRSVTGGGPGEEGIALGGPRSGTSPRAGLVDNGPGSGRGLAGGAGALAGDEEVLAARGGIRGVAGEPGVAGAGLLPGGRGRGEQDGQHRRKVDFGPDPERAFVGELPMVAPEAFGESPEQRRARLARDAADETD